MTPLIGLICAILLVTAAVLTVRELGKHAAIDRYEAQHQLEFMPGHHFGM